LKIEKEEEFAFKSGAAERLTPLGGPVKFKKFEEFPALLVRNTTSVSTASSSFSEDEGLYTTFHHFICLLIPHQSLHPSAPPLFNQDRVILNT
jgi:hypothetical protein